MNEQVTTELQEIANFCAEQYSSGLNPLETLREQGLDTHFEHKTTQKLFFMRNNPTAEQHNYLVVLLSDTDVTVFYKGSEATAKYSLN